MAAMHSTIMTLAHLFLEKHCSNTLGTDVFFSLKGLHKSSNVVTQ